MSDYQPEKRYTVSNPELSSLFNPGELEFIGRLINEKRELQAEIDRLQSRYRMLEWLHLELGIVIEREQ